MVTKSLLALESFRNKLYSARHIGEENEQVLLSELPEEMLLLIISNLTMNEAVRFSLVSHRCESVWRRVPVLIFEDSQAIKKIWGSWGSWEIIDEERPRFVKRVNSVLEKYLGTTIDELRIITDLDQNWQSHVDKWGAFAIDKQVKRLEFNFTSCWRRFKRTRNGLPICGEPLDLSPKFTGLFKSSLNSLCLRYVNVTDDFVDYLSHWCPQLEKLCIEGSKCLTRISGSFQVKHLEVSLCPNLKKINISATKLQSFILYGQPIELHIVDASCIFEMSIGTRSARDSVAYAFASLSKHFSQLVYLCVRMIISNGTNVSIDNDNVVAMPYLQHLELHVFTRVYQSLGGWISLIAASPSIQKLTLKLMVSYDESGNVWPIRKWDGFPLKCLKTLELVGYVGQPVDLELAFFVLENASMLEEVIVDFFLPLSSKRSVKEKQELLVKLQSKLPQGIKLTVKGINDDESINGYSFVYPFFVF